MEYWVTNFTIVSIMTLVSKMDLGLMEVSLKLSR